MDADSPAEPESLLQEMAPAEDQNLLDPATTERKIYRTGGVPREIWRPGDGDGDQMTDYYERIGPPLPLEQRWRLFQTHVGKISKKNPPPKFVMLDDRSAHEVLKSDIPRGQLSNWWPHDFGGTGKIRARRPHRGRAAIKNEDASGDARYYATTAGTVKQPHTYYFKGEKDYEPFNYRYEPPVDLAELKRKRPASPEPYNPRAHGHNQYTPKDMLVKYGAPTFSRKEKPLWKKQVEALATKLPRQNALDREHHKREVDANRVKQLEAEGQAHEIQRLRKALTAAQEDCKTWKNEADSARADVVDLEEKVFGLEERVQQLEHDLATCQQQLAANQYG